MMSPFLIPLLFMALGKMLKLKEWPKTKVDGNQLSSYECGFSSFQTARRPFSIYFFLVGILFVVFDVELVLVMPFPFLGWLGGLSGLGVSLFFFILGFGLYHEWREGSLSWPSGKGD
uniref:NADH dehydrogenase subunit 3 n=1 Tax=Hydroides elegans TaxID=216498 RepID=UPI001FA6B95E|nr:NADH dehydrogenase subunit 3 [Hydroides elegans]UNA71676.1 NADH dehydrogenase subunit 3 [Hydroides elegans]